LPQAKNFSAYSIERLAQGTADLVQANGKEITSVLYYPPAYGKGRRRRNWIRRESRTVREFLSGGYRQPPSVCSW
jgi:hypothetical protein